MADLTRTYTGRLPAGRAQLPTRSPKFRRGVPLAVTADEAEFLDRDPDWAPRVSQSGEAPDLELLDKPALLALAGERGITVNARLGAPKLRQAIAEATTNTETQEV